MPRKSVSAQNEQTAQTAADQSEMTPAVEKDVVQEAVQAKAPVKAEAPLSDTDEIEVVSMIGNVSYLDKATGDFYEWEDAGHTEYMTVATLNNMWRNHKSYFRCMWLRPNDERVIKRFGLANTYKKYEYLMDASNYVRENSSAIVEEISHLPNDMKRTVCNKVKTFVVDGDVTDVAVIRAIERKLNIDLVSLLN